MGLLRREEALGLVMGRKKISTPALPFSSVLFEPAQQFGPATATEEVQTETVRQHVATACNRKIRNYWWVSDMGLQRLEESR